MADASTGQGQIGPKFTVDKDRDFDPYTYDKSHVLQNRAGIQDLKLFEAWERDVTAQRIAEIKANPIKGDYDLNHLNNIHKGVFKDVFEWAGEPRVVDIYKGRTGDVTLFTFVENIEAKANELHKTIQDSNYLRGADKQQFNEKAAEIYAAVNDLHAFREGNGRTSRIYMEQLAAGAGYKLDYDKVSKVQWIEASKQAARGNLAPIQEVMDKISTVERARAFDQMKPHDAVAKHPELMNAYRELHDEVKSGRSEVAVRAEISQTLHDGKLVQKDISVETSKRAIDMAAESRGLMVRDAERLGGEFKGEVVAMSQHHVMLKINDLVSVRYERANLSQDVAVGDKVAIHYNQAKSQVHDSSRDLPRDGQQQAKDDRAGQSVGREIGGR